MSHIPFHKWGKQNNQQTQNLTNDVTLGTGAAQNKMIKPGEALFYSHQSGTYSFVENERAGLGRWGCFKDSTSIQLTANTSSILSRRWLQAKGATSKRIDEGSWTDRAYAIGISVNSNNTGAAGDSIAVQVSGVAQISWDDSLANADLGEFVAASSSNDGEIVSGGSGGSAGDYGILVNTTNISGNNAGYGWVKLNLIELY